MSNLLNTIIDYYLSTSEFNGLPIYNIENYNPQEMEILVKQGMVEALFDDFNPHIKRFNQTASLDEQLKHIDGHDRYVCFYPTALALSSIKKDESKPYTKLLQSGWGHYEVRFFEVEVLEQYFNDPKYIIFDLGY